MASRSCYKLCTFDVTNTLLKFKLSIGEQYAKVGRIYGVEREPSAITSAFMNHWKIMNASHPNFGCNHGLTSQEWWRKIVQKAFSVDGNEMTTKQLDCISNHLYDIYKKNVCWELVPGSVLLLEHLKRENITLGVISNFDERLKSILFAYNLEKYFNFVLASYLVQVAKPDKRIFDLALSHIPGVSSLHALHIGDDIKLDYLAAKSAGWNARLLCDKSKKDTLTKDIDFHEVVEDITLLKSHIFHV